MLVGVVRKVFSYMGMTQLSEADVLGFIKKTKMDKLPSHYVFMLVTIMPILELVIKKLMKEDIDFSELLEI